MKITLTVPTKHVDRIREAFGVESVDEFKEKLKDIVRDTVKTHEENNAVQEARDSIIVEEDLIS